MKYIMMIENCVIMLKSKQSIIFYLFRSSLHNVLFLKCSKRFDVYTMFHIFWENLGEIIVQAYVSTFNFVFSSEYLSRFNSFSFSIRAFVWIINFQVQWNVAPCFVEGAVTRACIVTHVTLCTLSFDIRSCNNVLTKME